MKFCRQLVSQIFFITLLFGCNAEYEVNVDRSKSYTINFDGTTTYGTLDTPWTPVGANWEIKLELLWDSSAGANIYPLATNSAVTSIYIDALGRPLIKYENSYISTTSTLRDNELTTIRFSISATQVKSYFNETLEKTEATGNTLSVPWTVIGAHASYSGKFKGQIRKITLTDLDDPSNSRVINLVITTENKATLSQDSFREHTGIDFTLPASDKFTEL